jgi:hypothetical protein
MTYWDDEKSAESSTPVELHKFDDGTNEWYYADGPDDVAYGGDTYVASLVRGERVEVSNNVLKNRTVVRCDWELPFAWQYIESSPDGIVNYTRYRLQGVNAVTLYQGTVVDVAFKQSSRVGDRYAEITVDPFQGQIKTSGLTLKYERNCAVALYSTLCGVDPESSGGSQFKDTGDLLTVDGTTLTATEFGLQTDGWYSGGKIRCEGRIRKILSHSGTGIIVSRVIPNAAAGSAFEVYAGCNRTTDCASKFDNLLNQRAHPNIPEEENNPFGNNGAL